MPAWVLLFLVASVHADTLIALVEVCRHGARAPVTAYPWDTGSWPMGYGELTPVGMRQHYLNGVEFRRRFVQVNPLLSPNYNATELYVRTTDVNRTFMSAQSQLMGLYPTGPSLTQSQVVGAVPPLNLSAATSQIQKNIGLFALQDDYQSVPIHNVLYDEDTVLLSFDPAVCPYINEIVAQVRESVQYKNLSDAYSATWQSQVKLTFGQELEFEDAAWIGDTLKMEQLAGFPLPTGVSQEMFAYLYQMMTYCNAYIFTTSMGQKLGSSQFFSQVLGFFNDVITNQTTQKFHFFSAHDTTLAGFLSALQVIDWSVTPNPPVASTLLFQLWQGANYQYVNSTFNDQPINIQGCTGSICTLTQFQSALNNFILANFTAQCNAPASSVQAEDFRPNLFLSKRSRA